MGVSSSNGRPVSRQPGPCLDAGGDRESGEGEPVVVQGACPRPCSDAGHADEAEFPRDLGVGLRPRDAVWVVPRGVRGIGRRRPGGGRVDLHVVAGGTHRLHPRAGRDEPSRFGSVVAEGQQRRVLVGQGVRRQFSVVRIEDPPGLQGRDGGEGSYGARQRTSNPLQGGPGGTELSARCVQVRRRD